MSDRSGGAGGHTGTAALALHFVDTRYLFLQIANGLVRAKGDARPAARTGILHDVGGVRLQLHLPGVDQRERLCGRRPRLSDAVGDVLRSLACPRDEYAVGKRVHGGELRVALEEEPFRRAGDVEHAADVL